jgi:preprotein translocase subunit SecD
VENNGRFEITITLMPNAAEKMASATSAHIGRPLAIIVDGEVIAAPTVRSQITNEALPNREADSLGINGVGEGAPVAHHAGTLRPPV